MSQVHVPKAPTAPLRTSKPGKTVRHQNILILIKPYKTPRKIISKNLCEICASTLIALFLFLNVFLYGILGTTCDPGFYCDGLGMTHVRAACDPGYYCINGSDTSQPLATDLNVFGGLMGGPCPRGGYCEAGSYEATPCPQGTYQNATGSRSIEECTECYSGYYCANTASPGASGPCAAGYYCTTGAENPYQHVSPPGYYSTAGSSAPIPCDAGYYAPGSAQSECWECPAGFYCPNQTTIEYTTCPSGFYCPNASYTPTACPLGTYSTEDGLGNSSDCTPCDEGYYCGTNALPAPTGQCSPGFWCTFGSTTAEPVDQSFGGWCPVGHYCEIGTIQPEPCPAGLLPIALITLIYTRNNS